MTTISQVAAETDGTYGAVGLPPVPEGAVMLTVHIQRYNPELDELPHTESYRVPALPGDRLLNVLHYIKWYIDGTLTFRRSCAHGVCGSDAMRINGRNRLCCKVLVKDLIGMTIVAAFLEELLFRGILFRFVEEFAGTWAALIATSGLFGLAHITNANATWTSSIAIMVEAGMLLGGAYVLARNLWVPMGLHAAWNFTQGFVFDVPVSGNDMHGLVQAKLSGPVLLSGGAFGLEASMIGVVLSIPLGLILIWLAGRRGRLVQPRWKANAD